MTSKEYKKRRKIKNRMKQKLALIFGLIVLALVGLSIRIVYINKSSGEKYTKKVLNQQESNSTTLAYRRGDVYDRNGTILATSEKVYSVILDPRVLAKNEEFKKGYVKKTLNTLAKYFSRSESELRTIYNENIESSYVVLEKQQTKEQIAEMKAEMEKKDSKIAGVWFEEEYKRIYPYNSKGCNVIGYTVSGNVGQYGIEEYYSSVLNGTNGRSYSYLNESLESEKVIHEPTDGYSVMSTIDITLQGFVEEAIDNFMAEYQNAYRDGDGAKTVACLMMDPRNGEILAMASNRRYDLNHPYDLVLNGVLTEEENAVFVNYEKEQAALKTKKKEEAETLTKEEIAEIDAEIEAYDEKIQPKYDLLNTMWRNYCVSDTYEPGSTVKPMTVAAALESGAINVNETFYCDGGQVVVAGQKKIHCANRRGHGMITVEGSLMFSCNDALMQMAAKMGDESFVKYQRLFNFGLRTGIDLPGESRTDTVVYYAGDDAPYDNLKIGPTELATCSFGQGFNVSMIQVASAFSSCINGGYYYQPHVMKKIMDSNGGTVEENEGNLLRTTISEQTSQKIKKYLYSTMYGEKDGNGNSATGKRARIAGYAMGGKTGTAQKIPRGQGNYLVSFIGYAPYDEPQVVCYVIVDEPNAAAQATSSYAQKIWKEIMQKALPYLNIYETEEPPADMVDEYKATHTEKADESKADSSAEDTTEKNEPIIDPQTGEEVKKPEAVDDPAVDPETGTLLDPTQDDDYPSDILTDVQPSKGEIEGLGGNSDSAEETQKPEEDSKPAEEEEAEGEVTEETEKTTE